MNTCIHVSIYGKHGCMCKDLLKLMIVIYQWQNYLDATEENDSGLP